MDTTEALESIAKTLPNLLPDTVESMLVTFDTLAGLGDPGSRPTAARFLRDAATQCDETRRDRLLRAAAAVEAGEPCALTPEGLTGTQAAAAQTVTLEEWHARGGDHVYDAPVEQADESEEPPEIMEQEPPRLPYLRLPHFFSGLVVRAGRPLRDIHGREAVAGQVLRLLTFEHSDGADGQTSLHFMECSLCLNATTPDYEAIVENRGNQWFQPMPSVECLEDLSEAIDRRLGSFDYSDDDDEGPDEHLEEIREDVERCQEWLAREGERGPAPECESGRMAAQVFGRNDPMAAWVPILFAGVAHCRIMI